MTSRCSINTCINGNCPGCKNGQPFCNDPRCFPNCPDCSEETELEFIGGRNGWDWTLISIIGVLVLLVLILFIAMRYNWRSSKRKERLRKAYQFGCITSNTAPTIPQVQVTAVPVRTSGPIGLKFKSQSVKSQSVKSLSQSYNRSLDSSLNVPDIPDIPSVPSVPSVPKPTPVSAPKPTFQYNPGLDSSLNVPDIQDGPYVSPNVISQTAFTTFLPSIPRASIPSPANVSVASAKFIPAPSVSLKQSNDIIRGFQ